MRRAALAAACAAVLAAASLSGCMTVQLTDEGIFHPQKGGPLTAAHLGPVAARYYSLEPQTVTTSDGVRLEGVLLRRQGGEKTVLYYGPNMATVERNALSTARWPR